MDISSILSKSKINLEAQAFNKFGAVIQQTRQIPSNFNRSNPFEVDNLGNSNTSFFGQGQTIDGLGPAPGNWDVTPLSSVIASGTGGYDPKIKFLFKVSFRFDPGVIAQAQQFMPSISDIVSRDLTYVMKQIDMPKYKFEYEEFNYYNFRTKILKKIQHEALSFKFYDDISNNAVNFLNVYLKLLSPIHRNKWTANAPLESLGLQPNFENLTEQSSAQRSVLGELGQVKNILSQIQIDQYYLDRSNKMAGGANSDAIIKMNSFIFTNPRLESFDVDDTDYEAGTDPHFITCTFDFDALHIESTQNGTGITTGRNPGEGQGIEAYDILNQAPPNNRILNNLPQNISGGGGMMPSYSKNPSFLDRGQQSSFLQNSLSFPSLNSGLSMSPNISLGGLSGLRRENVLQAAFNRIAPGISIPSISPVSDNSIGGIIKGQIRSRLRDI